MTSPPITARTFSDTALRGIRILLVGMYYAPEVTGSAPYTSDVAEHLAALGAQVDVVTAKPHYPQWSLAPDTRPGWSTELSNGVRVHRVPCYVPATPTMARRLGYELSFVAAALPVVARLRPDVVVGTTPNLFSAVLAGALARLHRRPLLQLVQDVVSEAAHETAQAGRQSLAVRVLRRLEGAALGAASVVTVPTDAFLPALRGLGVDSRALVTVKNWSRVEPVSQTDRDAVRSRYGWDSGFVLLHTGNIGVKQGLEELVATLDPLLAADPTLHLVVMGDGNRRRALAELAAERPNVEVVDGVSQQDYPHVLAAADVLVVHEARTVQNMSLPSKLTSYFSAARPVIAVGTPGGATDLEVRSSGAGIFVANDDRTALAEAISQLRECPADRERLGAAGLRYRSETLAPQTGLSAIAGLLVTRVLGVRVEGSVSP